MQSLEAALHLVWKAAEAAAKSIEFVSREGDREWMGRLSPQLDTRGSLKWRYDADRQTDWVAKDEAKKDGRGAMPLLSCIALCTVWS